jgi:hypothetical protein
VGDIVYLDATGLGNAAAISGLSVSNATVNGTIYEGVYAGGNSTCPAALSVDGLTITAPSASNKSNIAVGGNSYANVDVGAANLTNVSTTTSGVTLVTHAMAGNLQAQGFIPAGLTPSSNPLCYLTAGQSVTSCQIAASSLSGSSLASNVTGSSLTSFGANPALSGQASDQYVGSTNNATAFNGLSIYQGTSGYSTGLAGQAQYQTTAANSTAVLRGVKAIAANNNTGYSVATAEAGYSQVISFGATDLITNGYGYYIDSPSASTGAITNEYGLYVKDQSVGSTNHWGVFQAGASDLDYIAGFLQYDQVQQQKIGTVIASAATIAPTTPVVHVSGTTAISTITPPSQCSNASYACQITLIPDGLWTTATGGNIALASTAVVDRALVMTYDPSAAKWYPSY